VAATSPPYARTLKAPSEQWGIVPIAVDRPNHDDDFMLHVAYHWYFRNPVAFVALDVLAATIAQLQHTTACRKRSVLDEVFVTPSAHRVHHASNKEYVDKNFGAVFIIWDRLFGTYAPEVTPVVFGLTGGKTLDTAVDVLVGGYPDLLKKATANRTTAAKLRYLVAAP
jgi:Fatty acid hydroxylase superfamily